MPHEVAPLTYEYSALEPHIDAKTMEIHHGKHHQTYVNNLNAAIEKAPELAAKSLAPVESFAYSADQAPSADGAHPRWRAANVSFGPAGTTFTILHDGAEWGAVESPLAGAFSVRNILAVIAAAESVGADRERVREGLRTYKSVKRRMEVRGEARGVTVIDDFAHHPTAIRETIAAARQKYAGHRLVAVYEPRSYTAQLREFEGAYETAFAEADEVILAGLFHPERYAPAS